MITITTSRLLAVMNEGLRNFVYLNESTLNDHLSSLGEGVPQEVVQQSGGETETSGEAKVGVPSIGLGAGGQRTRLSLDTAETTMRILAPYHFQRLEQLIDEREGPLFSNDSDGLPSRGATVEITGEVSPMGLFEFEAAMRSTLELLEGEVQQELEERGDQNQISEEEMEDMEAIETLIARFTGDRIPLQMNLNSNPYVIPLDRDFMRVSPVDEFFENRQYTVFGRVESTISSDEEWDPTIATRVLDRYVPEEQTGESLRAELKQVSTAMNISIKDKDLLAHGPGCVIHPIGMYW